MDVKILMMAVVVVNLEAVGIQIPVVDMAGTLTITPPGRGRW